MTVRKYAQVVVRKLVKQGLLDLTGDDGVGRAAIVEALQQAYDKGYDEAIAFQMRIQDAIVRSALAGRP